MYFSFFFLSSFLENNSRRNVIGRTSPATVNHVEEKNGHPTPVTSSGFESRSNRTLIRKDGSFIDYASGRHKNVTDINISFARFKSG